MEPRYGPSRCPGCVLTRQEGPYDVFVHMYSDGNRVVITSASGAWTFQSMHEAMSWIDDRLEREEVAQ